MEVPERISKESVNEFPEETLEEFPKKMRGIHGAHLGGYHRGIPEEIPREISEEVLTITAGLFL